MVTKDHRSKPTLLNPTDNSFLLLRKRRIEVRKKTIFCIAPICILHLTKEPILAIRFKYFATTMFNDFSNAIYNGRKLQIRD